MLSEKHRGNICFKVCERNFNFKWKKMYLLKILNPFVKLLYKHSHKLRSVFGDNYCTELICTNCSWKAPYDFLESLKHMYGE